MPMADDPNEPVELYRARGADEAHALRAHLEAAGVPARVDGELLGGIVGEVPFGWVTAPRLLVPRGRPGTRRAWPAGRTWPTTRRAGRAGGPTTASTGSRPSRPPADGMHIMPD